MLVRMPSDFIPYLERDGMIREDFPGGFTCRYPDGNGQGSARVVGDLDRWYYLEMDCVSPRPVRMELHIEERYMRLGIAEPFPAQPGKEYALGDAVEIGFALNSRDLHTGIVYVPPGERQKRKYIIIRERAWREKLLAELQSIAEQGEIDTLTLLEQAGQACAPLIGKEIGAYPNSAFVGSAAGFYLDAVVYGFFARLLIHAQKIASEEYSFWGTDKR